MKYLFLSVFFFHSLQALELKDIEIHFQVNTNIDAVSFEGKTKLNDLKVEEKKSFQINPALFSTDLSLRDEHMRNTIFSDANKQIIPITFFVESSNCEITPNHCNIRGRLALNNQVKNINLVIDGNEELSSSFSIKLSDFKISAPSFMGVSVQEDILISVKGSRK